MSTHSTSAGGWRLDPRVVAHLRARTSLLFNLWPATPALLGRAAPDTDGNPTAFAPTHWPDTEWSDTCSDFPTD